MVERTITSVRDINTSDKQKIPSTFNKTSQSEIGQNSVKKRKNGAVQQRKTQENAKEKDSKTKQQEKENTWVKSETNDGKKWKQKDGVTQGRQNDLTREPNPLLQ